MFVHRHPYKPIISADTEKLIVGTLPPPRFSTGELLERDVDFPYGSYYNSLWIYIDKIHDLNFRFDNSLEAIAERKLFLKNNKIGICDIVESAERAKIDASDLGMDNIKLRDVLGYLNKFQSIKTLIFTGGNSKNGPEYLFRRQLKDHQLKLKILSAEVPRTHQFKLPNASNQNREKERMITTISLTSASGSANRAIGSMALYKQLKAKNPDFNTVDFRVMQYREYL